MFLPLNPFELNFSPIIRLYGRTPNTSKHYIFSNTRLVFLLFSAFKSACSASKSALLRSLRYLGARECLQLHACQLFDGVE